MYLCRGPIAKLITRLFIEQRLALPGSASNTVYHEFLLFPRTCGLTSDSTCDHNMHCVERPAATAPGTFLESPASSDASSIKAQHPASPGSPRKTTAIPPAPRSRLLLRNCGGAGMAIPRLCPPRPSVCHPSGPEAYASVHPAAAGTERRERARS